MASHSTHQHRLGRLFGAVLILAAGLLAIALSPAPFRAVSPAGAADAPVAPPANALLRVDGWPAFHGGGPLRGEGPEVGPPPMTVRWEYVTNEDDPSPIVGGAAIVGETAYVADADGTLHAVNLADGTNRWRYESENGFETTPLVMASTKHGDDIILIGDLGGTFHAVAAKDGKKLWTVATPTSIHSSANASIDGRFVVFGNDSAEILCLNPDDGAQLWKASAGDRVNSAPAIGFDAALVSGCDAKLRAIKLEDGTEQFAADLGSLSPGSPAVLDDRMVIGTDGGRVVCLSSDGQKQLWVYEQVEGKAMVYSSPAASAGVAVVGARDRQVHAIDLMTGQQKWVFRTKGDVDSSPVISGGRVYVGSRDKSMYVLDLKTGEKLWEFKARKAISASPAVGAGVVIISDGGGTVYCFEPKK
jgi:outer membrane protein assembly factor BamB